MDVTIDCIICHCNDCNRVSPRYEDDGPMPWETDEDLLDLKPLEVLECVGDELTFAQRYNTT